ncbi:MAG: M24 family metallopeptidase [Planctomycetota bacterium]
MRRARAGVKDLARIAGRIADEALGKMDFSVRLSRADFRKRWTDVQAAMKEKGYDLGYACGSELDRSDAAWLAGVYDPIIERYGVLVPAEGRPVVLAGSEGGHVMEEACEASGADLAILREFQISDEEYRHTRFEALRDVVRRLHVGRSARLAIFSSEEFLPHGHYEMLRRAVGEKRMTFDARLLQRIKYVKSVQELRIIAEANKVADAAFRAMLAAMVPGVRESQIAGVGDFVMKALGAHRTGVPTIVTSGERNYTVIGPATDKVIADGDAVSLGLSPTWHGYHGIVRRTVRAERGFSAGQRAFVEAVEGLYHTVWKATERAAREDLAADTIDAAGKRYLAETRLKDVHGRRAALREPYSYIHNTGCSECQEGFGAVTGQSTEPLGERVALMIDCALVGFEKRGRPRFPLLYAVVEDAFWKNGSEVGVYNRTPINAQHLVGNERDMDETGIHPYHAQLEPGGTAGGGRRGKSRVAR